VRSFKINCNNIGPIGQICIEDGIQKLARLWSHDNRLVGFACVEIHHVVLMDMRLDAELTLVGKSVAGNIISKQDCAISFELHSAHC
jgi:hypothetical protein